MKDLKRWDVIEIEWADSTQNGDWQDLESALKWPDDGCNTVGYYLQHNENTIMVVVSYFDGDAPTVAGAWTIPLPMVKEIYKLSREKTHTDTPNSPTIHPDVQRQSQDRLRD